MNSASSGNAMTEVALALAMAFFSLMVLTMVSMGTPQEAPQSAAKVANKSPKMVLAQVSKEVSNETSNKATDAPKKTRKRATLIVFWKGQFLDRNLQSLDLKAQKFDGRVILALPPDLPMGQALDARAKIKAGNLVVSTLNDRWLDRLSASSRKEGRYATKNRTFSNS